MKKSLFPVLFALFCTSFAPHAPNEYAIQSGTVSFTSSANFETIKGSSTDVKGTVDAAKRTFSFSIPLTSFQGFINPQQKKHFNEKFVESPKYPESFFKGKIIEDVNLAVPGTYSVRGKGMLSLHGVEKERIIDAKVTVSAGQIAIDSKFTIPVEDHGIKVSKMNSLAIAKVVNVAVKLVLKS